MSKSYETLWLTTFSVEIIYYLKILFEIIVPVLSSNSEPILKTGLVFAYELRFRRSIYQNRSEFFFDPFIPRLARVQKIKIGQKVVTRSSFRGHKLFVDFEHVF